MYLGEERLGLAYSYEFDHCQTSEAEVMVPFVVQPEVVGSQGYGEVFVVGDFVRAHV